VIRIERHGDVTRLELSHARSRIVGLTVSAYLIRGTIVDSGFPAVGRQLQAFLSRERPRGAFITHSHEDHAGNVEHLARLGVPLAMDAATLERVRSPHRLPFYRRFTWGMPEALVTAVVPFQEPTLDFIATPGHSADHHVVWDAQTGTLFAGDLFLGVRVLVSHANERPRELVRALRRMISLGPQRMFDAHRGLIPRPIAALEAKVAWMEAAIGRIETLAERGWSTGAIQRAVLGREGMTGLFSAGEYSKRNFVKALHRESGIGNRESGIGN
jgi:glyoxylase-like metal-dependent hydrolase (beta-lactamase superfamily II)